MARHARDDDREDPRHFGPEPGRDPGYGAREGGYRDRADADFGDREGRLGRPGAGPLSEDRSPRFADEEDRRPGPTRHYGHEADYGDRRSRGGFPGYGERVGYLDRGVSGRPGYEGDRTGYGGGADFGSVSGAGYAGQQRGDYANTPGGDFRGAQGGFAERGSGRSYGGRGHRTDRTPDWREIDRAEDDARHFSGYGGAQMYDGGADDSDRIGGMSASREGYEGSRDRGYGGRWGAFGQDLSGPGRREDADGPHRGRGPKGWQRSDERIREDVSERLSDDPQLDASDITVSVEGGDVTLEGLVDDRRSKRRAEDLIERISGVNHVQNNLRARDRQGRGAPGAGSSAAVGAGGRGGAREGMASGANQPNPAGPSSSGGTAGSSTGTGRNDTLARGLTASGGSGPEAMSGGDAGASALSTNGRDRGRGEDAGRSS